MKTSSITNKALLVASIASVLLAACSAAPIKADGVAEARTRLSQLQANPELASRAPLAFKEAEQAVKAAEAKQTDRDQATHLVFMADRKISIAEAQAQDRLAVDQRKTLSEQRDAMRLQSRTQEADSANLRAKAAQSDARFQKDEAAAANARTALAETDAANQRLAAENARLATADAQSTADRKAQELKDEIASLQAKVTDRGLVVTQGDVLFESNAATLNSGGTNNLSKLAVFLNKYPQRTSTIEGHTDSIGSDDYNLGLSQRRADAVKSYLTAHGVDAARLTSSGKGKAFPIGDNASATGRQQNRRVEVIIANEQLSAR